MKQLMFILFALSFAVTCSANGGYGSESHSGAHSGAASQAGAVGLIDQSTTVMEADNLREAVPSVFSAGITAGGSNPCVVSIGGGVGVSGFGINLARAFNDGECNVRESLRLMAAVSAQGEATNQILMREIACQSVTYWDAFYRVYEETQDKRYFCSNPRPNEAEISLRREPVTTQPVAIQPVKANPRNYVSSTSSTDDHEWESAL